MAHVTGFWGLWAAIFVIFGASVCPAFAYDSLDLRADIAVKWDIMGWTGDGYMATVSIYNNQQFRRVDSYHLGWYWAKKEVIYSMVGARATQQGDCSGLPAPTPHSCVPNPTIVDLPPGVPYWQQVANCCRDGVISAFGQDPANSLSSFSLAVGRSGNTNVTIQIPKNLTLTSPEPEYTCSDLKKVPATKFPSADGKRFTQAYVTWNASCTYS